MTNIPNKLPTQKGDPLQIERLTNAINDILDYLQAKENKSYKAASSVCCDSSFRLEGDTKEGTMFHVCNNCNKACDTKLTEKKVEASKGECKHHPNFIKDNGDCVMCVLDKPKNHQEESPKQRKEKIVPKAWERALKDRNDFVKSLESPKEDECRMLNYEDLPSKSDLDSYIKANFVSKEKIKKHLFDHIQLEGITHGSAEMKGRWINVEDLLESLGLGD